MITLHIGVMGNIRSAHVAGFTANDYGTEVGHLFGLGVGEEAVIDGSWSEWGPEDREVGSKGLHLAVYLHRIPSTASLLDLRYRLRLATAGARVLDFALVTPANDHSTKTHVIDWSETTHIYLIATDKASAVSIEGATA